MNEIAKADDQLQRSITGYPERSSKSAQKSRGGVLRELGVQISALLRSRSWIFSIKPPRLMRSAWFSSFTRQLIATTVAAINAE